MSLTLYRRHTSKCLQGRPRHERTYESDELRRGFKRCHCPIQFEGKITGIGFKRKSTEKTSWEEAKQVIASLEASAGAALESTPAPPVAEEAVAPAKKDGPVTIEHAAREFLADIDARRMDESTRRKYRTMLKQLNAYANEFGFLYLTQFTVDERLSFARAGRAA